MSDFVRSDGGGFLTGSMIALIVVGVIFFVAGSLSPAPKVEPKPGERARRTAARSASSSRGRRLPQCRRQDRREGRPPLQGQLHLHGDGPQPEALVEGGPRPARRGGAVPRAEVARRSTAASTTRRRPARRWRTRSTAPPACPPRVPRSPKSRSPCPGSTTRNTSASTHWSRAWTRTSSSSTTRTTRGF